MKVSIITPMFNAADYIAETIESVLNQSHQNWELLISDDCSSDNSVALVNEYVAKDERIKLFCNTENSGPAETRNRSLSNATGRFMAFLDADDLWSPNKLEEQLHFMLNKSIGFSFTEFHRFKGNIEGERVSVPKTIVYSELLKNTAIATSTVLIDTKFVSWPIKMRQVYYDDFVLWLEILKRESKAYGLQSDLMAYRVLPGSVSRNKLNSAVEVWKTYRVIEKINILKSAWFFVNWTFNAVKKYRKF
ncbi:glycosyltransferase family 2 protein [uncultured Arcticibacterium sp.]|uniref:glycosyltransferase family 2 protein n=1 Tax=uncultured Arcticibacterium sp. TaxID=2173042 RepID=UPI0030F95D14